ncbi:hypothetical protein ACWIGI_31605 [Nocardia sp. NPDC055321]
MRIRAALPASMYQMVWTPSGFDVLVNDANPGGGKRIRELVHHVRLNTHDYTVSILDEWQEHDGGEISYHGGRLYRTSGRIVFGRRPDGKIGIVERESFSITDGRSEICRIAEELGWGTKSGVEDMTAMYIITAFGVLGALGTLVAWLLA